MLSAVFLVVWIPFFDRAIPPFLAGTVATIMASTLGIVVTLWITRATSRVSEAESLSATERQVAETGDVLTRDFEQRIKLEVDKAVARLTATADNLIRSELAARIDSKIGENLVQVLGEKLSEQTDAARQVNSLRQDASDRFVQMRTRALQYADRASRQSEFFRFTAVMFALLGVGTLGFVLLASAEQYMLKPDLLTKHYEWPSVMLRYGPTYGFVILSEFLALIMFRYQSKSLEYMRYFSNEATNLDARHIAFLGALTFMDKPKFYKLIEKLESTERNFLINKNQRTLEMANNEIEAKVMDQVKSLIGRHNSAKQAEA